MVVVVAHCASAPFETIRTKGRILLQQRSGLPQALSQQGARSLRLPRGYIHRSWGSTGHHIEDIR